MKDLETQQRQAEAMLLLYDLEEDEEELIELQAEIVRFETWAEQVRSLLVDQSYLQLMKNNVLPSVY